MVNFRCEHVRSDSSLYCLPWEGKGPPYHLNPPMRFWYVEEENDKRREENERLEGLRGLPKTQHDGTHNAVQVSWHPALSAEVGPEVHSKDVLRDDTDLWNVLQIMLYQIYDHMCSFIQKVKIFGFTKNQTSVQHPPSGTNIVISLILG